MKKLGKAFKNSDGHIAIVLGVDRKTDYGNYYYKVKFVESGYSCVVESGNLIDGGSFKDYGRPSVYGVGYSYRGSKSGERVYKTWSSMLERCYNEKFSAYYRYGGAGVKVCDRWLHFKNFETDIRNLPNYEMYLLDRTYTLDKDILGDSTLYSPETCMFASKQEQSRAQKRLKPVKVTSPNGEVLIFPTIKTACMELGVQDSNVHKVLNGIRKHTRGYKFERIS